MPADVVGAWVSDADGVDFSVVFLMEILLQPRLRKSCLKSKKNYCRQESMRLTNN